VVQAITEGIDAVGEVSVRIHRNTVNADVPRRTFTGHGVDLDIIVASARAYLNALNKLLQSPEEPTFAHEDWRVRLFQS
jgi:2-isopropylmalate synthase